MLQQNRENTDIVLEMKQNITAKLGEYQTKIDSFDKLVNEVNLMKDSVDNRLNAVQSGIDGNRKNIKLSASETEKMFKEIQLETRHTHRLMKKELERVEASNELVTGDLAHIKHHINKVQPLLQFQYVGDMLHKVLNNKDDLNSLYMFEANQIRTFKKDLL